MADKVSQAQKLKERIEKLQRRQEVAELADKLRAAREKLKTKR
jgi:hypothetical protein